MHFKDSAICTSEINSMFISLLVASCNPSKLVKWLLNVFFNKFSSHTSIVKMYVMVAIFFSYNQWFIFLKILHYYISTILHLIINLFQNNLISLKFVTVKSVLIWILPNKTPISCITDTCMITAILRSYYKYNVSFQIFLTGLPFV